MCHYCGCRQMPLIRDYIAEHERATDLGGDAVRAFEHGDFDQARRLLADMAEVLSTHWRGEEDGIFTVMSREVEYADYIAPLVREHRELGDLLATVDPADEKDQHRIRTAIDELHEHISKEEDGLFPASLIALSGEDWDASIAAWQSAHPGAALIPE